jgi:hemolysin activation/secretion protein
VTSLYAQHPFIRTRNANLYGYLGYDHKNLMDRFDSIEVQNPRSSNLGIFGLSGDLRDNLSTTPGEGGITSFSLTGSMGDLTIHNPNQMAADQANTGRKTAGSFTKTNISVSRLQTIVPDLTAQFSLTGQMASKNLDSSERISVGGPTGVRAYPVGELPSDGAWIFNGEVRWAWRTNVLPGEFGVSAFYDAARASINKQPRPGDRVHVVDITGYGFGLSWNRANDFSMRLQWAFRPSGSPLPTADVTEQHYNSRIWLQAIKWW